MGFVSTPRSGGREFVADEETKGGYGVAPLGSGDRMQRIPLAGGSYVVPAHAHGFATRGSWHEAWVVNRELGSEALSMLRVRITEGRSPVRCFPGSQTAIFVLGGRGSIFVSDREFHLDVHDGVYVGPGEGFAFESASGNSLELVMTVCPQCEHPQWPDAMPANFAAAYPQRLVSARAQDRHATGDRFYQLMVDERVGCSTITQFIGAIPLSRAPEHFHRYEETIAVLSGGGYLWTGDLKAPVGPGSLIYLPPGQKHCLECTDPAGLLLAGMFYPSGSPAERHD